MGIRGIRSLDIKKQKTTNVDLPPNEHIMKEVNNSLTNLGAISRMEHITHKYAKKTKLA